jgi:para-aminobenzoate synthetase component II
VFLMIDHYDSFVYNLVRYIEELGQDVQVFRHDCSSLADLHALQPQGILLSPGPGKPQDAHLALAIVDACKGRIPILGVCLGHQVIGSAFGASVVQGKEPVHGKVSTVTHDGQGVFHGVKNPLRVTRYHSLVVDRDMLPACLQITCETTDGVIMGMRHKKYFVEGVQFHPEAELSECGHQIIRNFLDMTKR